MNTSPILTDLPVLTEIIAADGAMTEIPTLTEIVPAGEDAPPLELIELAPPIDFYPTEPLAAALNEPVQTETEQFLILTAEDDLPPALPSERNFSSAEMQVILDHFTTHLESVFTEKLDRHLQQLHHQAIRLAILELKDELPELLRNILPPANPEN